MTALIVLGVVVVLALIVVGLYNSLVRARVRVEMSGNDGKLLDTTVSINRGGTFIVAGPKVKDGILMLPVRADY